MGRRERTEGMAVAASGGTYCFRQSDLQTNDNSPQDWGRTPRVLRTKKPRHCAVSKVSRDFVGKVVGSTGIELPPTNAVIPNTYNAGGRRIVAFLGETS